MTFFTSDIHGYHNNIIKLCNRPFNNMDEMLHTIITNNNSVVSDSDIVYDLGDFAYKCNPIKVPELLKQLKGVRRLLPGNHDKIFQQALNNGYLKDLISSGKVEIIGEFYPNQTIKILEIERKIIVISHYALRSWPHAFRGSINLFGHSHSKLPPLYRSFDVGVDAWNFFPVSFNQVLEKVESIQDFKEI